MRNHEQHRREVVDVRRHILTGLGAVLFAIVLGAAVPPLQAQTFSVLYSFQCGTDGSHPYAGLARDKLGDLFGTTYYGGTFGKGSVFELTAAGAESVLYDFAADVSGGYPAAGLIPDTHGNLYSTTVGGGASGLGVVFKLNQSHTESVLYDFPGGASGGFSDVGLVVDSAGNLYGTTFNGGANGFGTVFKLAPGGAHSVLHSFAGTDGANPQAGLVRDTAGNLYGTTLNGGSSGDGVVFKVAPSGVETVLHDFVGAPTDGSGPAAGLLRDAAGNLYGTTNAGGSAGNGAVFKIDPSGTETILYNFQGGADGRDPSAVLVEDSKGDLFGTTQFGGSGPCLFSGCGVIFEVTPAGVETVVHSFSGFPTDGAIPFGGLIADSSGNLYGTTSQGGASNCGTVFKLTP